jgi:hypothetical protein
MRIFIDLDSRRILTTATRPASRLEFKRRDNDAFEVQFLRAGAVQELPEGTVARVGLKATNDFAGEFLATDTLAKSGTGLNAIYSGEFNLNTTALEQLFSEEPQSLTAMLEVQWTTGTQVGSSLTLPCVVHNDVIRGDEGDPSALPLFYTSETSDFLATQAQAEDGQDNATWMSPLRTAQAIAALAASDWESVSDKPTTFPPAAHTHEITDTTGLQAALAGKAAATHYHTIPDTTGLQAALDGKQATGNYAPATHTHSLSDLSESGAGFGQVPVWDGFSWTPADPSGGVSSWNDLTDKPSTFPPSTHTHAAADTTSGTFALARIPTGTTSSTVALGNHTHGNISSTGSIGSTSGVPIITGSSGVLQAGSFGTTAGTFAAGNHTHSNYVTTSGGITAIAVVSSMPATPDPNTLYIVS